MIAIPLLEGDPDVPLDLQAVFDQAYDFGPYFKEVAYGEDAVIPPLTARSSRLGRRPAGSSRICRAQQEGHRGMICDVPVGCVKRSADAPRLGPKAHDRPGSLD